MWAIILFVLWSVLTGILTAPPLHPSPRKGGVSPLTLCLVLALFVCAIPLSAANSAPKNQLPSTADSPQKKPGKPATAKADPQENSSAADAAQTPSNDQAANQEPAKQTLETPTVQGTAEQKQSDPTSDSSTPTPPGQPGPQPAKCKLGVYIISLYDLNPNEGTFSSDFWLWFNHQIPESKLPGSAEFKNAKESKIINDDTETVNNVTWCSQKIRAKLMHEWDISAFPYDRQELKIVIEEGYKESDKLVFEPDEANSKVSKELRLDGWRITNFRLEPAEPKYDSNFGNPESREGSTYSGVTVTITIERDAIGLFYKLHIGVYIALVIATLAFFMHTSSDDIFSGRIGLLVGMLFASILNAQTAESAIGHSNGFSLSDKIHSISYCYIFLAIILTLVSRMLSKQNDDSLARKIDRICSFVFLTSYLLINFILILSTKTSSY